MGEHDRCPTGARLGMRAILVAIASAALALVALPTGATADHRVPPPPCPLEGTLEGIERAPGGVILTGAVTEMTPEVGRVHLSVINWYHRGRVEGLDPGEHPAAVDVVLGPRLSLAGTTIPEVMPQVGSWFLLAGTWAGPGRDVVVTCGVLANVNDPASAPWLQEAEGRYAAVAPTPETPSSPLAPLDAPWVVLGAIVAGLLVAAAVLETIADARDPLPAA